MAVTFRIFKFLAALALAAFLYAILLEPVNIIEGMIVNNAGTRETQKGAQYMANMWVAAPVLLFIAAAAWLIKQGVVVRS